ncbi:MAG TPA: Ig-like domain-containing protein [Gammaproteobacteria bacterium]|nr:Ig-like domain-containing protein [Gammaproteobacteria bacterium]
MQKMIRTLRNVVVAACVVTSLGGGCGEDFVFHHPTTAWPDLARIAPDTSVTLDPLANDFVDGERTLALIGIGQPAHGTAVMNGDGTVTYTPSASYVGPDVFSYQARDSDGTVVTSGVYVTVGTSERVVYLSNQDHAEIIELYVADLAHPAVPFKINSSLGRVIPTRLQQRDVRIFDVSQDGRYALYIANQDNENVSSLYLADLNVSTEVVSLLPQLQEGQGVTDARFLPDSARIVFTAVLDDTNEEELYLIDITRPGEFTQLSPGFPKLASIDAFQISPDGNHVIYQRRDPPVDTDGDGEADTELTIELYVVNISVPGVATKLNGNLHPERPQIAGFSVSPVGTLAAYVGNDGVTEANQVFLVDYANPGVPVRLNSATPAGGIESIEFSLDGQHALYIGSQDDAAKLEVYLVDVSTPGVSVKLNPSLGENDRILTASISPDNSSALLLMETGEDSISELYRVTFADPGNAVKLNAPLSSVNDDVVRFRASETGEVIAYVATDGRDENQRTITRLYEVNVTAPAQSTILLERIFQLATGEFSFRYHPAGDRILTVNAPQLAVNTRSSVFDLYVMDRAQPDSLEKLSSSKTPGDTVLSNFVILP